MAQLEAEATSEVNRNNITYEQRLSLFFNAMKFEKNRLTSFSNGNWPVASISKELLANAGFFYLLISDRVQCAFCKGIVCLWQDDEIPLAVHRRHYPSCRFIVGYDVGNVPIGTDPVRHSILKSSVPGAQQRFEESDWHHHNGLTRLGIIPAIKPSFEAFAYLYKRYASFSSEKLNGLNINKADLARKGFFYNEETHTLSCFSCGLHLAFEELSTNNIWEQHAYKNTKCVHLIVNKGYPYISKLKRGIISPTKQPDSVSQASTTPTESKPTFSPSDFGKAIDGAPNKSSALCRICFDDDVNVLFNPCGHMACSTCSTSLKFCPFCKGRICSYTKAYLC